MRQLCRQHEDTMRTWGHIPVRSLIKTKKVSQTQKSPTFLDSEEFYRRCRAQSWPTLQQRRGGTTAASSINFPFFFLLATSARKQPEKLLVSALNSWVNHEAGKPWHFQVLKWPSVQSCRSKPTAQLSESVKVWYSPGKKQKIAWSL